VQVHDERDTIQTSPYFTARDRYPQPLTPAERQVTGHNKAVRRPDSERLHADGKKNVTSEGKAGVPGAGLRARETGARGSRVSQHSAHACGSAIGRAILHGLVSELP